MTSPMTPASAAPAPEDITITWQQETVPNATVELVVIIPTFKRPDHLVRTLRSVVEQQCDLPFAIIVMDNHAEGREGAEAARAFLETQSTNSVVLLAHRRGNCSAYNAGLHTALDVFPNAEFVQIIDDDEIARPGWLQRMVSVTRQTGADFTGAPQHPIFEGGAQPACATHPVFRPPYDATGEVPILYSSGNVLIKTQRLKAHGHPWLDERFNFLGGGDSDFYARCKKQGARFAWAHDAGVDETTPLRRTEATWLNSRSLRNGSISALIQQRAATSRLDTIKRLGKTLLLLAASPYRSLTLFVKTGSVINALDPMNVALGRMLMELGFANEQYRAADKN